MDKAVKNKNVLIGGIAVIVIAAAVMVAVLFGMGILYIPEKTPDATPSWYNSDYGTAIKPEGRTLVISILPTDKYTTWNGKAEKMEEYYSNLSIACEYLETQAEKWGKSLEMIYDYKDNQDIVYFPAFENGMVSYHLKSSKGSKSYWNYVNTVIPSETLAEKYNADNVIYFTCFETTGYEPYIYCFANDNYFSSDFQYDSCFVITDYFGRAPTAAVYVHEMLHLFGSPDLYKAGRSDTVLYGTTREFVGYARENLTDDIMMMMMEDWEKSVKDGEITYQITDIIAYYIGWLDERPEIVERFGLDYSTHDPEREAQMAEKNKQKS